MKTNLRCEICRARYDLLHDTSRVQWYHLVFKEGWKQTKVRFCFYFAAYLFTYLHVFTQTYTNEANLAQPDIDAQQFKSALLKFLFIFLSVVLAAVFANSLQGYMNLQLYVNSV